MNPAETAASDPLLNLFAIVAGFGLGVLTGRSLLLRARALVDAAVAEATSARGQLPEPPPVVGPPSVHPPSVAPLELIARLAIGVAILHVVAGALSGRGRE